MIAKIRPSFLSGQVDIIISKSYAHRLLIAATLADGETLLTGRSDAKDISATIGVLSALGASIINTQNGYLIRPIGNNLNKRAVFDCGESGSTLRFMLPVAAALGVDAVIKGEGRLSERPIAGLTQALKENGLKVNDRLPLNLSGKIRAGEYRIRGDISSQYITGLLFSLPLLDGDSKIVVTGGLASAGYIDITLETLKIFGIEIYKTDYGFFVKGNQKYKSPGAAVIEGDWSNAAFWLTAAAVNGDITVKGLSPTSLQGDREIIDILNRMGADIDFSNGIRIKKCPLKGIEIDAQMIPDAVPALCVAAGTAKGKTVINNVERLKDKESDRLEAVQGLLTANGIRNSYNGNLNIQGGVFSGGKVDGHNDHRIVMAAAIAATAAKGETYITCAEAVKKSYPDFFKDLISLGGKVDVIDG